MSSDSGQPSSERVHIERGSAGPDPGPSDTDYVLGQCEPYLADIERQSLQAIFDAIGRISPSRDRTEGDAAFSPYPSCILFPYARHRLTYRAALFARTQLIPQVLSWESERSIEIHKGALFYNTALAHLLVGDEARFEYFLAMTDEEDFRTHAVEAKARQRGTHSLKTGKLTAQTITAGVRFATDLLNGILSSNSANFAFLFGSPVTEERIDQWRRSLDGLHHAELFRFLYEAELFCGRGMPEYCAVRDNPYVMLRLVKTLAHAGQWVESRLTALQKILSVGKIKGSTLARKLGDEPSFAPLATAAGNVDKFAGTSPKTTVDTDAEIRQLLNDLQSQSNQEQKDWRTLRVLYIIRNSTAHQIDEDLAFYTDRKLLLELLQVVFLSYFVIEKRMNGRVP